MEEQDYVKTKEQVEAITDAIVGRYEREMDLRTDLCKAELEKRIIEAEIAHHEDFIQLIDLIQESDDMITKYVDGRVTAMRDKSASALAEYAAIVSTVAVILLIILICVR